MPGQAGHCLFSYKKQFQYSDSLVSYLALARKWRPRDFSQVVGQEHVVNALKHALDNNRVHHAFLLTGTRGIGKTTLARILAKSLNCQTNGVSSTPCNKCSHCQAVDEGRFIDLIEVDAASRTKVDDTRDLLDNVQYAPTTGEYKIYLIDEVHMLSGHSFNALLKTLEEPPPHVKFVLATTDPQKLPVTVLSRCLQFYLKALSIEQITSQIKLILDVEKIEFQESAVRLLARSAKGSMRDALSLLDQTIAFGGGKVEDAQVRSMLGLVDDRFVFRILDALASDDVNQALEVSAKMAEKSVDFVNALEELLAKFHQISLLQFSPDIDNETITDKEQLLSYIDKFDKETLQLFYQMTLLGKRDIYLAPELRTGMEMTLLRMIAFAPEQVETSASASVKTPRTNPGSRQNQNVVKSAEPEKLAVNETQQSQSRQSNQNADDQLSHAGWPEFAESLGLTGFAREVVMNSLVNESKGGIVELFVDDSCSHLVNDKRKVLIQNAFIEKLNRQINLKLTINELTEKTPQQLNKEKQDQTLLEAEKEILSDPNIKELMENLDATIIPGSVKAT